MAETLQEEFTESLKALMLKYDVIFTLNEYQDCLESGDGSGKIFLSIIELYELNNQ